MNSLTLHGEVFRITLQRIYKYQNLYNKILKNVIKHEIIKVSG